MLAFGRPACYTRGMKYLTATITDKGGRAYNQDYLRVKTSAAGVCAVVCDGLGAYDGSDEAARLCADCILDEYADGSAVNCAETLQAYVRKAHGQIVAYKDAHPELPSICTTVACAVADDTGVCVAHVGDSRIYVVRDGKPTLVTRDHSLARAAVDRGEIALHQIPSHKDQNKLTRVLGGDSFMPPDCETFPPLAPGDGLILCTDGVWEHVFDADMERLFAEEPAAVIDGFVRLIEKRKSEYNDNYTAVVVKAVR